MWHEVFFKKRPDLFLMHLRRIRSFPYEGEERFRTLVLDMRYVEVWCEIKIFPPSTLDCKNVKLFSRNEVEIDQLVYGKHNKRN